VSAFNLDEPRPLSGLFAAVTSGVRSTNLTGRGEVEADGVVKDGTELEQPVKIWSLTDGRTEERRTSEEKTRRTWPGT
jgi:hypothetical protein